MTASFLIGITFSGCEKELYQETIKHENRFITKRFSMNSETNTKLTKAVNLLKTQKENKSAKIIYDTIFDFYYDDQNGIYIETGTKNTYTFPVFRSTSDGKIENILFTLNDKNEYDIYLVKYDLTKEELETLTNEQLSLIDKDYFGLYVDGKVPAPELECIDILQQTVVPIDQGDLTGNFGYQTVWVVVASFCSWNLPGGGGEGEGEGDSSNSSSNGTTGNSSSNSGNSGFVTSNTGATTAIVPMSEESIRQKNFALTILSTEQRDWLFDPLNDAGEQSIYAFLEQSLTDENGFVSTDYSTANINFVIQMINLAIQNNTSFGFNNTITPQNSQNFDNIDELNNYLNNFQNSDADNITIEDNGNNTKTSRFNFNLGAFAYLNVQVKQKLQNNTQTYDVENVSSSISGATLAMQWIQNEDDDLTVVGNTATITFTGTISMNCFFEGVGVFFSDNVTIVCHFNISTGALISGQLLGLD